MWEDRTKTSAFQIEQYVIENTVMTKSLGLENVKMSVDFGENCGDGGNLSWVGFVRVLRKRKDIADKRTEVKAQMWIWYESSCVIGFEGSCWRIEN